MSEARQREEDVLSFGQWFCQIFRQIALMFVRAGHLSSRHIEKVQDPLPVVTCDEPFFFRGKGVNRRTEKRRKLSFSPPIQKGKKESRIAGYSCGRASLKNAFACSESFVWLMFCERDGAECSIAFLPIILIFLTNKNSSLIYSVIICEQKNKGQCAVRVFRIINSQLHCCFYEL